MKLHTMLLPTGEFVFVLSDVPSSPDETTLKSLREFKEDIGAAGMLVLDGPVEVEDALWEENAVRVAYDAKEESTDVYRTLTIPHGTITAARMWDQPEGGEQSISFTVDARPGDENLARALFGGQEFSPAGLVVRDQSGAKKVQIGEVKDLNGDVLRRDAIDYVLANPPAVATDVLVAGADLPDPGPWVPRIGDKVIVNGPDYFHVGTWVGVEGEIVPNRYDNTPAGHVYVAVPHNGTTRRLFMPIGSIEPAPLKDVVELPYEEPKVEPKGDAFVGRRVRIEAPLWDSHQKYVGDVGEVVEYDDTDDSYRVRIKGVGSAWASTVSPVDDPDDLMDLVDHRPETD